MFLLVVPVLFQQQNMIKQLWLHLLIVPLTILKSSSLRLTVSQLFLCFDNVKMMYIYPYLCTDSEVQHSCVCFIFKKHPGSPLFFGHAVCLFFFTSVPFNVALYSHLKALGSSPVFKTPLLYCFIYFILGFCFKLLDCCIWMLNTINP